VLVVHIVVSGSKCKFPVLKVVNTYHQWRMEDTDKQKVHCSMTWLRNWNLRTNTQFGTLRCSVVFKKCCIFSRF